MPIPSTPDLLRPASRLRFVAAAFAIALVGLLLRVPLLDVPLISDEGAYAYVARSWSDDYQLYRDIPFDRPQGIFLVYRLALGLGQSATALRAFAALVNFVTTFSLCWFMRRWFGVIPALITGALFAILSTAPTIEGFTGNAELYALLPTLLAVASCLERRWFSAGLLAGVAFVLKPSALSVSVFTAWMWWHHQARGQRAASGFALLAGLVLLPSLSLAHGLDTAGQGFVDSLVSRRLTAYSFWATDLRIQWQHLLAGIGDTWTAWGVPAVGALGALTRRQHPMVRAGFVWTLCSVVGMALGGMWHAHYFMQWLLPLCVLAGPGFADLGSNLARPAGVRRSWSIALVGLTVLASAAAIHRDLALYRLKPRELSRALYHRADWAAEPAAAWVRAHTRPDDSIYVAFAQAQLYFLAHRRAAAPQLFYREIEFVPGVWQSVVDVIDRGVPRAVVLYQDPPTNLMSPGEFRTLVERRYRFSGSIGPLRLYLRRPSSTVVGGAH